MRILVIDDQAQRYKRLIEALEEIGVMREQVDIVQSADQAHKKLRQTQYDLLVLDILLPLRPEGDPGVQHSLDLLFELHETDNLRKPGRILGITADKEIAGEVRPKFEAWTWTLIQYSESTDEWINRILNCVNYLICERKNAPEKPGYGMDLAIICALAVPELQEVLNLPWNWSAADPIDDLTFVHRGHFILGDRTIDVCATAASRMGMVSTALLSAKIIALLKPRLLAMCGICAGVKGKVHLGDVLLADPAWDFQSGKRVKDKGNKAFSISPHQLYVSSLVRSHVEQIRADRKALANLSVEFGTDAPGWLTKLVVGPVASGSAVLADEEVVQEIKSQHRDVLGVEMEVYGMYAAADTAPAPQPKAFALKAVCDFADPDKDDTPQRYAAYASANTLRLLMERFGPRLLEDG